jgi:D-amino-acid dehydrogenase
MPDVSFDVVIVGAGAVGACTALELARSGATVAVVETGTGWAAGCSWGNAGLMVPSHASPFAEIKDLARATGWLARPDSPFGIDVSVALAPWLGRLLYECVNLRHARIATAVLRSLSRDSFELHAAYAAEGLNTGYRRDGLLDVYRTEAGFRAGRKDLAKHAESGEHAASAERLPQVLSASEARELEPLLGGRLAGAIFNPNEAHCDPGRFVPAVGGAAQAAGATLLTDFGVTGLRATQRGVRVMSAASELSAGSVVLATGAWTPELAPRVPIVSGTGCSIDLTDTPELPRRPTMLREARIGITPFDDRVRFAGTMLLARSPRATVDPRRIEGIYRAGTEALPSLRAAERSAGWIGNRPCTPDGLPRVGWAGPEQPNVVVAAGHAMHGLSLSPITAKLVQGLLEGKPDARLAALAISA